MKRVPGWCIPVLCCLALLSGPSGGSAGVHPPDGALFREAAEEVGLIFRHFTGATGEFYLPEIMGAGVALFDYDGDGDLDIYLVQGAPFDPGKGVAGARLPPPSPDPSPNRLFKSLLVESGELRFVDVTDEAGVGHEGYGMGVAVGDYNNNGYPDLYVTNFGSNVLYRNNGDGTFTDVTREAGVDDPRWSASAAFVDFDRDGHLDLFVTNYLDFTLAGNRRCMAPTGETDYCTPAAYRGVPDRLFRNDGKGRFSDVTQSSGIGSAYGPGLGVVCADFDGDGWIDMYVANDGTANLLWMNRGNGTFEEMGLLAGVAYNADGLPEAGMGVTAADFDNDGDEDILVTNLTREGSTVYLNDGRGFFRDVTREVGLLDPSFLLTGFGVHWFDFDNDGWLDLYAVNGAVTLIPALRGDPYPFHQLNQLFRNLGERGRFQEVSGLAGRALALSEVSRGAAFGDIDNDGDIDVVVSNNNGPVRLLLNQAGPEGHWLLVRLQGTEDNRDGLGARLVLTREGEKPLWRRAHTDGSYLSASDPRVHFGLGTNPDIESVEVHWPKGGKEVWRNLQANTLVTLEQGQGEKPEPAAHRE